MRLTYQFEGQKVKVGGGRGHTVSAEPGGHTACCDSGFTLTLTYTYSFHTVLFVIKLTSLTRDKQRNKVTLKIIVQ